MQKLDELKEARVGGKRTAPSPAEELDLVAQFLQPDAIVPVVHLPKKRRVCIGGGGSGGRGRGRGARWVEGGSMRIKALAAQASDFVLPFRSSTCGSEVRKSHELFSF
jgi:hypothetical protein